MADTHLVEVQQTEDLLLIGPENASAEPIRYLQTYVARGNSQIGQIGEREPTASHGPVFIMSLCVNHRPGF